MEFNFIKVEKGSFGGKGKLADDKLVVNKTGIAVSQNLTNWFANKQITQAGSDALRYGIGYDPGNQAIVLRQTKEGFALHKLGGRKSLQGRLPSKLKAMSPPRGRYALVLKDDNQLIFRLEK